MPSASSTDDRTGERGRIDGIDRGREPRFGQEVAVGESLDALADFARLLKITIADRTEIGERIELTELGLTKRTVQHGTLQILTLHD